MAFSMAVTACTPRVQDFFPITKDPMIEGDQLVTGNNGALPLRSWLPEGEAPQAVIIALHGFNDYSNAFKNPGEYLAKQGIALYAYDQRGFGTAPERGIWAGEDNLITDLAQMVNAARRKHPGVPVFVLGESMGGAVVIAALASEDFPKVDGVILSAPAVWGSDTMNNFYRSTLWLMSHTIPAATVTGQGIRIQASDNIPMLRALGQDPLVIKETRIDAIYGIVGLMDRAYLGISDVHVPMLILYGANDQVIPKDPISRITSKLSAPFTMAYYPEGYHMLLRDLKSEVVLGDIIAWVNYPQRPLPSGYDRDWQKYLQ